MSRLLWFVTLWALSVAAVLAAAGSLRWLLARILHEAPGRLF